MLHIQIQNVINNSKIVTFEIIPMVCGCTIIYLCISIYTIYILICILKKINHKNLKKLKTNKTAFIFQM